MVSSDSKKRIARSRRNIIAGVANTFEWLITAFILAFVFRAFVMEAFRIPTGSMADTLKGAHYRLCCPQCGFKYDYNFPSERSIPFYDVYIEPASPRCPSCGYLLPSALKMPVSNGDRILVLKCVYQLFEPKRWDVVVFKNPGDPRINFIKRLVGRPGETVEIIDGDIYINGQIERKPPMIQQELWMPVYNNDYQPVRPNEPKFNGHKWQQPFRNRKSSKWQFNGAGPTVFTVNSSPDRINVMFYDTGIGNDFKAIYAYDPIRAYGNSPETASHCSDLMVRFYVDSNEQAGCIGIGLSKYETHYRALMDLDGEMTIAKIENGTKGIRLAQKKIDPPALDRAVLVRFANVDHQLVFEFGDEILTYDLGRGQNDAGPVRKDIAPEVMIFGSGKLILSHIAVFRDTYYTTPQRNGKACFAGEGAPFKLNPNEFFVLGDNSPASHDCRFWFNKGIGNGDRSYRPGIVPRDYLVGKAVFVYWPSGFKPFGGFPLALIPNVGQMRFIYGGSNNY